MITVGASTLQTWADGARPAATMGKPPVLLDSEVLGYFLIYCQEKEEKRDEVLGFRAS